MRTHLLMLLVLSSGFGCAAPQHVGRTPLVPPIDGEAPKADFSRDQRVLAASDAQPTVASGGERGDSAGGSLPISNGFAPPTYRTVVHIVEAPVFVESPTVVTTDYAAPDDHAGYGPRGYYGYYGRDGYPYVTARRPFFPIHTAVGAGIGAVIGHQSGRRHRGAWIGGSVGLMMDLGRWWR